MKKVLLVLMGIMLILSFTLVGLQAEDSTEGKEIATKAGEAGEEKVAEADEEKAAEAGEKKAAEAGEAGEEKAAESSGK